MHELVNEFREVKPAIVLTHTFADLYSMDHAPANSTTLQARVYAQAAGYPARGKGSQRRAVQAVRNSGTKGIRYAEAFQRVYPQVTDQLS